MYASIAKNTLLSPLSIEKILSLPKHDQVYVDLIEIIRKFQDIRKFASEIHTEIHLVKPILKHLDYTYESKPKYFEDNIKGPDITLFATEEDREKSSRVWGMREYFDNTLGIILLKRYGRNLMEGISGFFLEFENKIPFYQTTYLLKKSRSPWGILTNGKQWILMKRPSQFEKRFIEMDVETALFDGNEEALHLFFHIFSLAGLQQTVPQMLEEERNVLIDVLSRKKAAFHKTASNLRKSIDIYPKAADVYSQFIPDGALPATEAYLSERGVKLAPKQYEKPKVLNEYDVPDIFSHIFLKQLQPVPPDFEALFLNDRAPKYTKEEMLSLKMLDMTPGFGNTSVHLLEALAYLSFILPYRERNSFVAEWEDEATLRSYIVDNLLYGIERSRIAFDILQNTLKSHSRSSATHYRPGNPLIGMSLRDISGVLEAKQQMGLFGKHPRDVIADFRETYRLHSSLSTKIKEDMLLRNQLQTRLDTFRDRIRDLMDILTATYFTGSKEQRKVQDVFFNLDSDNAVWESLTGNKWFAEAKAIAKKNGFFHMEIEFPFLLSGAFDFIFVRPLMCYAWEDNLPPMDVTKTYIKKGMTYLKPEGRMVLIVDDMANDLFAELKRSKKYDVEKQNGLLLIKKKPAQKEA